MQFQPAGAGMNTPLVVLGYIFAIIPLIGLILGIVAWNRPERATSAAVDRLAAVVVFVLALAVQANGHPDSSRRRDESGAARLRARYPRHLTWTFAVLRRHRRSVRRRVDLRRLSCAVAATGCCSTAARARSASSCARSGSPDIDTCS